LKAEQASLTAPAKAMAAFRTQRDAARTTTGRWEQEWEKKIGAKRHNFGRVRRFAKAPKMRP